MSYGNTGRVGLSNHAMNEKRANDGQQQHCNRGAAGEHGGGIAGFGCGIFPFNLGHHSAKAPQTITVTQTLSPTAGRVSTSSRAVASASSLAKSSATSRIPTTAPSASAIPNSISPQSIISVLSSATASPRSSPSTSIRSAATSIRSSPSTSIRSFSASASASAPPSKASATQAHSATSTSKPSSSIPHFSLSIPLSASSQSPKGISTILTSKRASTTSISRSTSPAAESKSSSSSLATNPATFVTALSITAPYPSTLSEFFPAPTDSNPLAAVLPQGLGPESQAGHQASQEGGIIAGLLLGVLFLAFILVAFIYTRWRRNQEDKEHRRSIGSLSLNGDFRDDEDKVPILGRFRRSRQSREMKMNGSGGGGIFTGSLRTKDSKFKKSGGGRRDTAPPVTGYSTDKEFGDLGMGGALDSYPYPQDWDPEKDALRRVTMPAPAFAPLRANRSSSVYSGSLLNALSENEPVTPAVPPRNPRRGISLNFGFEPANSASDTYGANAAVQRSSSEPKRGSMDRGAIVRNSWRKERSEQWPRTMEDFRRSRNLGDNMRRGRPVEHGEKVYTVVAPSFNDEDEEMKVYREGSWGGNNPFKDPERGSRESENPFKDKHDSGKSGVPSLSSSTDTKADDELESQKGVLHIGIRGSDTRGAWRSSHWKDGGGLGKETWGEGGGGYGGYGYGDWKDEITVLEEERPVTAGTVWSEAERYEEMRRGYKGKIRLGMGVQRRMSGESRYRNIV